MSRSRPAPSPASAPSESSSFVKRHWGVWAALFFVYSAWAFLLYNNEFFPMDSNRLWNALSCEGIHFPPLHLCKLYGLAILIFGIFLTEALAWGWVCLRSVRDLDNTPLAKAVLAEGLGLGLFSGLAAGLGFSSLFRVEIFWGVFGLSGLGVVGLFWRSLAWRSFLKASWADFRVAWSQAGLGLFKILVLFSLGVALLMDFVPEVFYDSLFYHLALPHLYLLEHRIVNMEYMNFAHFPQGMEMLFAWGLALQGDIVAKLMHGIMGPLSFLALLIICRRLGSLRAWPLAACIVLTIPVVSITLTNTSVDIGLLFYSLLSLYGLLTWLDPQTTQPRRWAVLTGLLCGIAFSIKYMGASVLVAVFATVVWIRWTEKTFNGEMIKQLIVCGLIGVAWTSPWLMRNALTTGNPFYPLFYTLLGGRNLWPEHMAGFMSAVRGYVPHGLWGWIRIPWALTVGEPKGPENTCWLGPTFWVILPSLFFLPRRQRWMPILVVFTLVNFLAESAATNQARYLLQGYAGLALLLALGLIHLYDQGWRAVRGLLLLPFLGAVFSNVSAAILVAQNAYRPSSVLIGDVSREAYTSVYHPGENPDPMTPLYQFMKTLTPVEGSQVVFFMEEKTYGCPWPYIYGNVYDRTPLVEWTRQSATSQDLYTQLMARRVHYIIYNEMEGHRLKTYGLTYWTDDEKKRFAEFWNRQVRPLYANQGLYLFQILPEEEAARRPLFPCPLLAI